MNIDLSTLTVAEARKALDSKKYSALDLTNAYLAEIQKKDKEIHAYLEVWEDLAREEAQQADAMIAAGTQKALTGIPIAVKDNILIKGRIASSASKILENYHASYDATVIAKLKEQGVVFLGRTNMDEFALGSSTENSAYGPTRNPHDTTRVPGGTSGGSAAAVAANMTLIALGSDTGGSIRYPAGLCGVVGIKTTYGMVSRYGLMSAASSLDQIGAFGKTVEDAQAVFEVIKGYDNHDSTSLPQTMRDSGHSKTKKIGVPRAFVKNGVEPDMYAQYEAGLAALKKAGYEIVDVDMPTLKYALAIYYIINPAEVSTNLSRFDGIRYGAAQPGATAEEIISRSRGVGFGPETRRRVMVGAFVLSAGYADAYYRKARALREVLRADFVKVLKDVDAIAMPISPVAPFKIGEKIVDTVSLYAVDIFTVSINLAGVPGMAVPFGTVEREGKTLPVGFQLVGPHCGEDILFAIGRDLEQV
jgi:aspartyl-tRNA(Asn)/glutamyl-tRNA(Gln) amidotransferase subunit A